MMPLKFLLFDIDGTLIHSGGAGKLAIRQTFQEDFGIADPQVDIDYGGRTDQSLARELLDVNRIPYDLGAVGDYLEGYHRRLPAAMKECSGKLLPGVRDLLNELHRDDGVVLGIVTGNTRQGASVKLSHFDIDQYFVFGGYGDVKEARSEIAYQGIIAAQEFHGSPLNRSQFLVIGDTPSDVACARDVEVPVLAVLTGFASESSVRASKPDHIFEDLTDIDKFRAILRP